MRTGIIGAEPRGFYNELAAAYEAAIVSPQAIYFERGGRGKKPVYSQRGRINKEAERRARIDLLAGKNVVYDGRLNQRQRRDTVRQLVAQPAGAQTILLCVRAPEWLMEKRLREKVQQAHPDDAKRRAAELNDLERAMHGMMRAIQWPMEDEPHLALYGGQPKEALIRQTQEYVSAQLAATNA